MDRLEGVEYEWGFFSLFRFHGHLPLNELRCWCTSSIVLRVVDFDDVITPGSCYLLLMVLFRSSAL